MDVDSDLEAIADTFDEFSEGDQEADSPEGSFDEIDGGETDPEEQPEEVADEEVPEGDDPEDPEAGSEDQARILLGDGTEVTLDELKDGYFREADYTRKTTELAHEREQLTQVQQTYSERSSFVDTALLNLTNYLENLVPPEPHVSLAQSNPAEYQYQKALRENAMAELSQVLQMREEHGQAQQGFSQEDVTRLKGEEDAKLLKAMPHLSDPGKRAVFDKAIRETAVEFGFTEDEAAGVADHRMLQLVHYARLGKRAVTNRKNAKRRVEAPKKGKARPAQVTAKSSSNRKARERLSKSGSIDDAMGIDFD